MAFPTDFEIIHDFIRMPPKVKHSPYDRKVTLNRIVNGIGEPLGQHAVVSVNHLVNSGIEGERVNIREERIKEVHSDAISLKLVKRPSGMQISDGRG